MHITKLQCVGNDFFLINCFYDKIDNPASFAAEICDRHFGVGADGLVLLLYSNDADFRTECFNVYGEKIKVTPNILICAVKYAIDNDIVNKTTVSIDTDDGIKYVTLSDDEKHSITVNCGIPIYTPQLVPVDYTGEDFIDKTIVFADNSYQVTSVSIASSPYSVIFVSDGDELNNVDLDSVAPRIAGHNIFPVGTNVVFANVVNNKLIQARCWKIGEKELIGFEYGAAAAFVAGKLNGYTDDGCTVQLLGGDLNLEISDDDFIYITGSAENVFDFER